MEVRQKSTKTIYRKKRRYLRYCPEGSRYKNMAKIRKREIYALIHAITSSASY